MGYEAPFGAPRFPSRCEACKSLGHWDGADWYFCDAGAPRFIRQAGPLPHDEQSRPAIASKPPSGGPWRLAWVVAVGMKLLTVNAER
jgi:hypothetical protein